MPWPVWVSHYWQRWLDERQGDKPQRVKHPHPLRSRRLMWLCTAALSTVGSVFHDGRYGVQFDINAIIVFFSQDGVYWSEFARWRDARKLYDGLQMAYHAMVEAFSSVVILLVAAGVFAQGLKNCRLYRPIIAIGAGESRQFTGGSNPAGVADGSGSIYHWLGKCRFLFLCRVDPR